MSNLSKYQKTFQDSLSIKPEKFNENLKYNEIPEWDSIGHMKLFLEIEKKFQIKFDQDDIVSNLDYNSILSTLEIYLDEKNK